MEIKAKVPSIGKFEEGLTLKEFKKKALSLGLAHGTEEEREEAGIPSLEAYKNASLSACIAGMYEKDEEGNIVSVTELGWTVGIDDGENGYILATHRKSDSPRLFKTLDAVADNLSEMGVIDFMVFNTL